MYLHNTPDTQLFLLSYRAHGLCANIPFQLTRRLWPSCHSDMGGSRHGWGFSLRTKRYPSVSPSRRRMTCPPKLNRHLRIPMRLKSFKYLLWSSWKEIVWTSPPPAVPSLLGLQSMEERRSTFRRAPATLYLCIPQYYSILFLVC